MTSVFLNSFNTGYPLGVNTQGFVGVSYSGVALGQRVSHIFGIRNCIQNLIQFPFSTWIWYCLMFPSPSNFN